MLNEQQLKAINTLNGKLRIIAGAGSGKTTVLTQRYVKLIESGVDPQKILCITFTNKAAQEMRNRIYNMVDNQDNLLIKTFHSYCLMLLRKYIHLLGFPNTFTILDSEDQSAILKKIYKDCNIDFNDFSYMTAKSAIAYEKVNKETHLLDLLANDNTLKKAYAKARKIYKEKQRDVDLFNVVYLGYLYYEQQNKSLDFTDLILFTVILFKQFPEVLAQWQDRIEYIMVDEFQDASYRQYELVSMLSEKHGNLFVVGDPDQTIYSWRGAKPEILVDFDKTEKADTIILNQNYRSTPEILEVANNIIVKNNLRVAKDLFTENQMGDKVYHRQLSEIQDEADFVVSTIKKAFKYYQPKDIAVLYRMHYLSRRIEEKLIKNHIPYVIYSGVNFYERKEIKDILSYLKLLVNPYDNIALKRVINIPARGIGNAKINLIEKRANDLNCSLWEAMNDLYNKDNIIVFEDFIVAIQMLSNYKENHKLKDIIKKTMEVTGYDKLLNNQYEEERKNNLLELINSTVEYENLTLDEYLQQIALLTNSDKEDKNGVTLMTVHSAKGLEFSVVFVVGLNEGVFPNGRAKSESEIEEERRLAYVAYTRAKKKLILSNYEFNYNGAVSCPSRFVTEICNKLDTNLNINKYQEDWMHEFEEAIL